ncbi:hypothetical protein [Metabacillus sp. FJAT-52054]|uniref:Uncharacterized protein n=1 Tax=Metabacillus sediminis TaxID=3117746 RepID=A0ABZ2NKC1_9BACI
MNQWVQDQAQSRQHRLALTFFPIVTFLGYIHPWLFGIGLIVFFLVTSFKMLKTMLFYMLILGVISAIFPPLAPIILIVMIVLFFMRIGYVIKNWRPFTAGLILYGSAAFVLVRTASNPDVLLSQYFSFGGLWEAGIVSVISYFLIRTLLNWLYQYGYSSYAALGIMGSVPLIVISFILPFLKMHVGGDVYMPEASFTDGHKTPSGEPYMAEGKLVAATEPAVYNGTKLQHVEAHVRTAPDGNPYNNLSYEGPGKQAPNASNLVQVEGSIRSAPDGNPNNNLSANGVASDASDRTHDLDELADLSIEKDNRWKSTSYHAVSPVLGAAGAERLSKRLIKEPME